MSLHRQLRSKGDLGCCSSNGKCRGVASPFFVTRPPHSTGSNTLRDETHTSSKELFLLYPSAFWGNIYKLSPVIIENLPLPVGIHLTRTYKPTLWWNFPVFFAVLTNFLLPSEKSSHSLAKRTIFLQPFQYFVCVFIQ